MGKLSLDSLRMHDIVSIHTEKMLCVADMSNVIQSRGQTLTPRTRMKRYAPVK
ncbi:hypothetical protein V525_21710 [Gordonia alkanivorans CGMCC 6845]|uniref:Uncharacterized protein n=1 Tax=Gordonia alkanivorans CGMCC 6845 TaxID=1423140 RepID=W9DEQ7_9ACTN|nr:hypothetical protein V525_21710 [Gordonia alkanivorans CGMCC 6845]